MPSPVAHSLAGLSLAWMGYPRAAERAIRSSRARWCWFGGAIVLANLPDVDYVPGLLQGAMNRYHQLGTHSLVFAAFSAFAISLVAATFYRNVGWRRLLVLTVLLVGSHLMMDSVTQDFSVPYGMPLFWPFSAEHIPPSRHAFFLAFQKQNLTELFSSSNLRPVVREVAVTLPLLLAALALDRRRRARVGRNQALATQ